MNLKYVLTAIIWVLTVVSIGCQSRDLDGEPDPARESSTQTIEVVAQTFNGTGIVRNITPSRTHVVIEHQTIEGFMDAMTMPFAIRDDSLLQSIAIGDSVDFEIASTDEGAFISSIEIAE